MTGGAESSPTVSLNASTHAPNTTLIASPTIQSPQSAQKIPTSMEKLGQNRHRYLTPNRIQDLFHTLDPDHQGYIDHESIMQAKELAYKQHKKNRSTHRGIRDIYIEELMAACARNQRITFDQFSAFLMEKEHQLWSVFCQLDCGNDGELCQEDLERSLKQAGLDLSSKEISMFITHLDSDRDGVITFDEWMDFLMFLPNAPTVVNVFNFYQKRLLSADYESGGSSSKEAFSSTTKYLLAGSIAGAVSRSITAPLDRLKVLLQVQIAGPTELRPNALHRFLTVFRQIISDGGIWAFWRGNGLNIIKSVPEIGIRFYAFETAKRWLHGRERRRIAIQTGKEAPRHHDLNIQTRLLAGGIAGFCGQLSIYPMEVIKTRMMTEMASKESSRSALVRVSAIDIARRLWKEGGIRPFFRGLGPALLGIVPYASIDLTAYETFKNMYIRHSGTNAQPSPAMHLLCGACSGLISATAVYPLGLIRTRLQSQGSTFHQVRYERGAIDVILKTYEQESIRGFYKGLMPTLAKVVPAVSISYICYEQAKKYLGLL